MRPSTRHVTVGWRSVLMVAIVLPLLLLGGLVFIPALSPSTGARVADLLRAAVGPHAVAELEGISNRIRDEINRRRFGTGRVQPQISWSPGTQSPGGSRSGTIQGSQPGKAETGPLIPASDVATAPPQIGWQPYDPAAQGPPTMARAMLLVDPQRSYAGVALVRLDLSQLRLHIMPGFVEPAHPSGIDRAIPDLGTVPPADVNKLVAAFNGGFKAVHGHYGMMANGFVLLPPINGMATVAVYKDGSVQIGAWGRDVVPSPDIVAFRQNCPPLIEAGQINPALNTDASAAWGFTHGSDITWRTGLGITRDGRYLIYAVGNGTNAEFLAEALLKAGAYTAMQLDINQYYAEFISYSQFNDQVVSQHLLDQMTIIPDQFLAPEVRDFFYLTLR
jgi:hypothetical protein